MPDGWYDCKLSFEISQVSAILQKQFYLLYQIRLQLSKCSATICNNFGAMSNKYDLDIVSVYKY